MNDLNSVIIEGNIACDTVIKEIGKDNKVCTFRIASHRYYKKDSRTEEDTSFFNVEAWGKLAETISKCGYKGRGVRITGYLKQEKWMGQDDKPRSKILIYALNVEFRKEENTATAEGPGEEINDID